MPGFYLSPFILLHDKMDYSTQDWSRIINTLKLCFS